MDIINLSNRSPILNLLAVIVLIAAAVLIYSNTLDAPFLYDDEGYIVDDAGIYMVDFDLESLKKAALESHPNNRPIPNISFALNFYFGRLSPAGYHWVNIGIHFLCAVFLFFFCRDTLALYSDFRCNELDSPGTDQNSNKNTFNAVLIAFFAALIWLAHPVNSSAVTYIVQRMTSLAVMFYILSLVLYIKGRKFQRAAGTLTSRSIWFFAGAILSGICALCSKQNTATLPVFILLYEWIFFQRLRPIRLKQIRIMGILAVIIFTAAGLYYLGGDPIERILSGYTHRDFTLSQRLLTEFRVVIYYIGLFFFPNAGRLIMDHDYPLSQSLVEPIPTILGLAAILACIALAFYKPRRHILLSFAIFWFFGHLLIESTIIPIEIIYEHRNYLPYMVPCLLTAFYLCQIFKKSRWMYIGMVAVLVLFFGFEAYQRNDAWRDPTAFWQDNAVKSPHKWRPRYNFGNALSKKDKIDAAIPQLREATRMQPEKPKSAAKKAQTYSALGHCWFKKKEPEKAIENYLKALEISPGFEDAVINIAWVRLKQGRPRSAINHLKGYLKNNPDEPKIHMSLGDAYVELNDLKMAAFHFQKALEFEPYHVKTNNSLGNVLAKQGKMDEAISHFQKAIRYNPEFSVAYNNLANVLAESGRFEEAIKNYQKALVIDPGYRDARENMERVKAYMGKRKKSQITNHK